MNAIGQPISRVDGRLKVTGGARYTADIPVVGAAHAAIVHSTIANGRTVSIDTAAAEKAPGVHCGLHSPQHAAHESDARAVEPPSSARTGLPAASGRRIHYAGQPIALVVAETLDEAAYAGTLIEVQYEVRESRRYSDRHSIDAAFDPPQFLWPVTSSVGDAGKALAAGCRRRSSRPTRRPIVITIRWSRMRRRRSGRPTAR